MNHFGDPCIYCQTPHDEVEPGPCPVEVEPISEERLRECEVLSTSGCASLDHQIALLREVQRLRSNAAALEQWESSARRYLALATDPRERAEWQGHASAYVNARAVMAYPADLPGESDLKGA